MGDIRYHTKEMGEGAGKLARQAESRGDPVPPKGWAADRTTTEGRQRRGEGPLEGGVGGVRSLPRGAGSGGERGQRDSLAVAPGRGPHANPHNSRSPRLAPGRFPGTPS